MSQYAYTVSKDGKAFVVLAGFVGRTATFYAKILTEDLSIELREVNGLSTDCEVVNALLRWGMPVPPALETALDEDLHMWQYSDYKVTSLCRKRAYFGLISSKSDTSSAKCVSHVNAQRRKTKHHMY